VGLPPLGSPNQRPGPQPPTNPIAQPQEIPLPQPENKVAIKAGDVSLKRVQGGWQLWAGQKVLRDFGDRETDARDALNVYRDLRPTEWVTIGTGTPVVEYALVNGRPPGAAGLPVAQDSGDPMSGVGNAGGFATGPVVTGAGAKFVYPIDTRTVRVEAIKGAWCLRDDFNIHLNFGPVKADADQALAVVQRYGFNRIGVVGPAASPAMRYFFAGAGDAQFDRGPFAKAALQAQIDGLTRVGIAVPGVGYVGESVRFDPEKLEVKKDRGEWLVVGGSEVLGRYGVGEWNAREAVRNIRDMHVNEFCKLGSGGLTFFLADGKAPSRVPFAAQGRRFDPSAMKVSQYGNRYMVTEYGRHLFDCATAAEGETLIRVVKHFGFDQICHLGPQGKSGVMFLAKGQ
jgi:hypothetical protein